MSQIKKHYQWPALLLCVCMLAGLIPFTGETLAQKEGEAAASGDGAVTSGNALQETGNALTDEQYRDFGFSSLPEQEAFKSTDTPLDGFEGTAMSQLYVGYMNKSKSQNGQYAVYNTMPRRSKEGAAISGNGSAGYLDGSPVSAPADYENINSLGNVESGGYRTVNSVSLDMGSNADGSGGKREVLCESVLLTGKERNVQGSNKKTSWLFVRTLVNNGDGRGYRPTNWKHRIKLADSNKSMESVDVRATQGLTAVAAGDYDGDGADELAVYVPRFNKPYIQLYDIGEDGSIAIKYDIPLSDLAAPDDLYQYEFGFSGWNLPIVQLTTASLSRDVIDGDSLVVSACLPRSDASAYKVRSQRPALAVYEEDRDGVGRMEQVYLDHLSYGDYYMRFPAAVEADINASGTKEIVVAGYADTWTDTNNQKLKDHPFKKYCVNMLVYDEDEKVYRMTRNKPLEYTPTGDVKKVMAADSSYAMSEPVALTAADLSDVTNKDYLFLEGAVLSFLEGADVKKDDTEQQRLLNGSLVKHMEMKMSPEVVTVSHAVSGRFAADHTGSEQIALVWHKNYSHPNAVVDSNITWIWMDGTNNVVQQDTNYQYLKGRDANGSGTFLTLSKVNDTANRAVYKYKGKQYGYSAPNALMSLPAIPYWKELPYGNGVGDVFFSVGNELEGSAGGSMNVSVGVTGSITAMMGAGMAGNKVIGGLEVDMDAAFEESVSLQAGLSVGNTQTYSAPGDKNHVLAYVTPVVTYEYEVWVPAFEVTQETAKEYKRLTGSDILKNEDGKVYKVGDTVPAGWYSYNMHVPYSPTYTLLTMEQYNEAYTKHGLGTGKIDMSAYDFTVGDPTTYKKEFKDIPHYNPALKMVSHSKAVTDGDTTNGIEFDAGASVSGSVTAGVQVSGSVLAKVEGEVNFFGAGKFEGSAGQTGGIGESITGEVGFAVSIGTGATINPLPKGYRDYSFETTMGVWPCAGHGSLLTTGFIVEEKADIPPLPPENPYVYETGMQENGKAFVVLAWEQPGEDDYRLAKEYEVFWKNTGADAADYQSAGKVGSLEQNFMLITGLEPGRTYDFAFQPLGGDRPDGGKTRPITATTAKASTLSVNLFVPEDVYAEPAGGEIAARFAAGASETDANNDIFFQWQRYVAGESQDYLGEWEDVPNESGTVQSDVNVEYMVRLPEAEADGAKYRCVFTSKPRNAPHSAHVQRVASRAATVHVGKDPRFSVSLSAHSAKETGDGGLGGGELLRERTGAYFMPAGRKVSLKAEVSKKDAGAVGDGTISLFYRKDGGAEEKLIDGLTPVSGVVDYEWEPGETGYYDLTAVYMAPGGGAATRIDESQGTGAEPSGGTDGASDEGANEPSGGADGASDVGANEPSGGTDGASEGGANEPSGGTNAVSGTDGADGLLAGSAVSRLHMAVSEPVSLHVGTIRDEVYVVRYELNGGENHASNLPAIGRNAVPRVLEEPTRVGADFAGWYEDAGFTTKVEALEPERIGNAIGSEGGPYVLYAKWTARKYTVTYELGDGGTNHKDNPAEYTLLDGAVLGEPERKGYRFLGWFLTDSDPSDAAKDVDKTKAVSSLPLMDKKGEWVAADLTLKAEWEAVKYPITYRVPLGTQGSNPDTYTVEDTVTLKEAEYNGVAIYHKGWYRDKEFSDKVETIGPGSTGALQLYNKAEFDFRFIWFEPLGGSMSTAPRKVLASGQSISLGSAARQGFEFVTWSEGVTTENGERVADLSPGVTTHDEYSIWDPVKTFNVLYAAWKPAEGQVEIHWLNPADEEEIYQNYGVKGEKIADAKPDMSVYGNGYEFDGKWYADKALTNEWNFETDVIPTDTGDVFRLYAGLSERKYTVAFDVKGGSMTDADSVEVKAGESVGEPKEPTWKNHIFLGWFEDEACTVRYDFDTEVQGDLTLYAGWRGRGPIKPDSDDNKILGIEDGRKYAIGSVLDFTAAGAGMDNDFPIEGDERYVPKNWSVNPSGTWSGAPYVASFDTKDMALGKHTLAVTFGLERYESGAWKDTGDQSEAKTSFVLAKDVPEPSGKPTSNDGKPGDASRTGDENNPWLWVLLMAAALIGSIAFIIVKRRGGKKRRR